MTNNIELRDYFAGQALQGLLSGNYIMDTNYGFGETELMEEASKVAYIAADKMMEKSIRIKIGLLNKKFQKDEITKEELVKEINILSMLMLPVKEVLNGRD